MESGDGKKAKIAKEWTNVRVKEAKIAKDMIGRSRTNKIGANLSHPTA